MPLPDVHEGETMKLLATYPMDYVKIVRDAVTFSKSPFFVEDKADYRNCYVYLLPGHTTAERLTAWDNFEHLIYLGTEGKYGREKKTGLET